MAKYFEKSFAESGDKTPVSDDSVSSIVSYETGYTPAYELDPNTDPDGLYIDRQRFNQLLFDVTSNIKEWQEQTFPEFIDDDGAGNPFSYPIGAIVRIGSVNYQAIVDGTTTTPPSAEWRVFEFDAEDTAETVPVRDANGTFKVGDPTDPEHPVRMQEFATEAEAQALSVLTKIISPGRLGDAMNAHVLGMGQTWQDMLGSRAFEVSYTNTTGRPIFIAVSLSDGGAGSIIVQVDGIDVGVSNVETTTSVPPVVSQVSAIVPHGSTYKALGSGARQDIIRWAELR